MTRRKDRQRGDPERYLDRSLDDLEGPWGPPPPNSTNLVAAAHRLHATPLRALTDEELRIALSQRVGFPWTLSVALARLGEDPLCEGEAYPADLLCAALGVPHEAWAPEEPARLGELASAAVRRTQGNEDFELLRRAWARSRS